MTRLIRAKAPLRVSFAGGGTDVPPFPAEEGGLVLSAAINRYSYGALAPRVAVTSIFLAARNMGRLHYLFTPFVGFVLSYIGILIAIAEVAKAIWGPMQCRDTGFGF